MTKKTNSASKVSIEDFRDHVAQGLGPASGALILLIDVLSTGPRPASPVEMTISTRVNKRASGRSGMDAKICFHSHNSTIYSSAQSCARLGGGRCQSPVLSFRLWPKFSSNCHACAKQ